MVVVLVQIWYVSENECPANVAKTEYMRIVRYGTPGGSGKMYFHDIRLNQPSDTAAE